MKNFGGRLARLEREAFGGFSSVAGLGAAIQAELDELTPEEHERFLQSFAREEGLELFGAWAGGYRLRSRSVPLRTRQTA